MGPKRHVSCRDGEPEQTDPHTHPSPTPLPRRGKWSSIFWQCQHPPPGVHCTDEETQACLEVLKLASLKVVEMGLGCWQRGRPLPRSVGGLSPEEPSRWEKKNEPEAHWPAGEYLVPSKILAGKKHQRKGEKEKQKLSKLAQLASLASPHCPRGKKQGRVVGDSPHLPGRAREGGWEGWPSGSLPAPETLELR